MSPAPRFFIVRPDTRRLAESSAYGVHGPIVPLVAVDDLPEWLDIAGVPRELSVEQTIGLCNLGTERKGKGTYAVKINHQATPVARQQSATAKVAEAKAEPGLKADTPQPAHCPTAGPSLPSEPKPAVPDVAAAAPGFHRGAVTLPAHNPQPQEQGQQYAPGQLSDPSSPPPQTVAAPAAAQNPTAPVSAAKTEYCRHWCHRGTCKWGIHCRYLHAMPTTAAELAAVGLREIPRWWIAAVARHPHRGAAAVGHNGSNVNANHTNNNNTNAIASAVPRRHITAITGSTGPGPAAGRGGPEAHGARARDEHKDAANITPTEAAAAVDKTGHAPLNPGVIRAGTARCPHPPRPTVPSSTTHPPPTSAHTHHPTAAPSRRAAKAQLRETVALLRELGFGLGHGHNNIRHNSKKNNKNKNNENGAGDGDGGGGARKRKEREKEANKAAAMDREALVRAGRADLAAVATDAAAAAGYAGAGARKVQGRDEGGHGVERVVEEEGRGQGPGNGIPTAAAAAAAAAAAQTVGMLVDV